MNTEWAHGDTARRRPPLREWKRRRLIAFAVIAVIWIPLMIVTGGFLAGTVDLLLLGCAAIAGWAIARSLGIDARHPLVRFVRQRPWRDPEMIIVRAARALRNVLIIGVAGRLLAPTSIEIALNPADLDRLSRYLESEVREHDLTEQYLTVIREYAATVVGDGPVRVSLRPDPGVPVGTGRPRYSAAHRTAPPCAGASLAGAPVGGGW